MADLPRKGDRVRVTETHVMANITAGSEVILTEDAKPSLFVGACEFVCRFPGHCNEHQSGPVKVEILERANSCPTCRESPVFDARCPCPTCGGPGRPEILDRAGDPCKPPWVEQSDAKQAEREAFARGMRRAVAIAASMLREAHVIYELSTQVEKELKEAVENEILGD